jgi:hypothetical protein
VRLTQAQIREAVGREKWQTYRLSMKGAETKDKLSDLSWWLLMGSPYDPDKAMREVQVQNYLNALSRGGLIAPTDLDQTVADQIVNAQIRK